MAEETVSSPDFNPAWMAARADLGELWRELCLLFIPDPDLAFDVIEAAMRPEVSLRRQREQLAARGIDEPEEVDPWLVLLDGLERRGLAIEPRWTASGREVTAALASLPAVVRSGVALEPSGTSDPWVAAGEAHRELSWRGLALLHMDIVGDRMPLVVTTGDTALLICHFAPSLGRMVRTADRIPV